MCIYNIKLFSNLLILYTFRLVYINYITFYVIYTYIHKHKKLQKCIFKMLKLFNKLLNMYLFNINHMYLDILYMIIDYNIHIIFVI